MTQEAPPPMHSTTHVHHQSPSVIGIHPNTLTTCGKIAADLHAVQNEDNVTCPGCQNILAQAGPHGAPPMPRKPTTAEQRSRRARHVMRVLGYTHNREAGIWERIGGGTSDGMPIEGPLLAHLIERGGASRIIYVVRHVVGYECWVDHEAFGTECNLREALCAAVSELAKRS